LVLPETIKKKFDTSKVFLGNFIPFHSFETVRLPKVGFSKA